MLIYVSNPVEMHKTFPISKSLNLYVAFILFVKDCCKSMLVDHKNPSAHETVDLNFLISEKCVGTDMYHYNGWCYSVISSQDKSFNYYEAKRACNAKGSHLASIHSSNETEFLEVLVCNRTSRCIMNIVFIDF